MINQTSRVASDKILSILFTVGAPVIALIVIFQLPLSILFNLAIFWVGSFFVYTLVLGLCVRKKGHEASRKFAVIYYIIFIVAMFCIHYLTNYYQTLTFTGDGCKARVVFPLETEEQVLCYAASISSFAEGIEETQDFASFERWKYHLTQEGSRWNVHLRSLGMVPSYSCKVSFGENGDNISPAIPGCGSNK